MHVVIVRIASLVAAALVVLLAAVPASAHVTGGGSYRAAAEPLEPASPGLEIEIVDADQGLSITAPAETDVLVRDPTGRPLGRIDDRGTWRRVFPDDPDEPVNWYRVDGSRTLELAIPWMDEVPATFVESEASGSTTVSDWRVDIDVDGRRHVLAGDLVFEPGSQWLGNLEYGLTAFAVLAMLVVFARDAMRRRRVPAARVRS